MKANLKKYFFGNKKLLNNFIKKKYSKITDLKNLKQIATKKNWFLNKSLIILWTKFDFILPLMLNSYILVYNGHTFSLVFIKQQMIGHRIGEFILTKKLGNVIHNTKKRK